MYKIKINEYLWTYLIDRKTDIQTYRQRDRREWHINVCRLSNTKYGFYIY